MNKSTTKLRRYWKKGNRPFRKIPSQRKRIRSSISRSAILKRGAGLRVCGCVWGRGGGAVTCLSLPDCSRPSGPPTAADSSQIQLHFFLFSRQRNGRLSLQALPPQHTHTQQRENASCLLRPLAEQFRQLTSCGFTSRWWIPR